MADSAPRFVGFDHVQLAMPAGGEAAAHGGVLGMIEIPKPAELEGRSGVWFGVDGVELHLGVDPEFRPAQKAHPALRVSGLAALIARCEAAGHAAVPGTSLPGRQRVHVTDPFGNRIELLEIAPDHAAS